MEMRKCPNGHFYDASVNASCPYCNGGVDADKTMPLGAADDEGKTLPLGAQAAPAKKDDDEDGKTVAIIRKDMGIDPVVGWIVCTEGEEKGKDFRIHTDNNFIGRSEKMDICIKGDETISRENHAVLSFDSVEKVFYFSPGDGRSIVRVNGKSVFQTVQLNAYDVITIGKTEFSFVPFCGEKFSWN